MSRLFAEVVQPEKIAGGRRRAYDPATTFWAFLGQVFRDGSLRDAVHEVQAMRARFGWEPLSMDTSAYSQARQRLPAKTLEQVHERVLAALPSSPGWNGRRVLAVDGTGVRLADTAANQAAFPQPGEQRPGCGFPVMQLVGLYDVGSGAMLRMVESPLNVHEAPLMQSALIGQIEEGDVLLGDRAYCSYHLFASLRARGADAVMRLHQARKKPKGNGSEWTVEWKRPRFAQTPEHVSREEWEALPESLTVRYIRKQIIEPGYRPREIIVATTLLEAPAEELLELHLRRWEMELSLRDLKTSMGMETLRGRTPAMVLKELRMYLIAHNLLRWLMLASSALSGRALRRISFKGTLDALHSHGPELLAASPARGRALRCHLLWLIAADPVPRRPGREEPRAVKARPKPYQRLTRPRHQMRVSPSRRQK